MLAHGLLLSGIRSGSTMWYDVKIFVVCTKTDIEASIIYHTVLETVLWRCWLGGRKGIRPVKNWVVGCWRGYLGWGADLHVAQQMPLPLTVSCSSKFRLVLPSWFLPFWYLLTWVVPDKFQKSSKTIVHVCVLETEKIIKGNWKTKIENLRSNSNSWESAESVLWEEKSLQWNGFVENVGFKPEWRREGVMRWSRSDGSRKRTSEVNEVHGVWVTLGLNSFFTICVPFLWYRERTGHAVWLDFLYFFYCHVWADLPVLLRIWIGGYWGSVWFSPVGKTWWFCSVVHSYTVHLMMGMLFTSDLCANNGRKNRRWCWFLGRGTQPSLELVTIEKKTNFIFNKKA